MWCQNKPDLIWFKVDEEKKVRMTLQVGIERIPKHTWCRGVYGWIIGWRCHSEDTCVFSAHANCRSLVTHRISRRSRGLSNMEAEMSGRVYSARQHAIRVRRHRRKQRQRMTLNVILRCLLVRRNEQFGRCQERLVGQGCHCSDRHQRLVKRNVHAESADVQGYIHDTVQWSGVPHLTPRHEL